VLKKLFSGGKKHERANDFEKRITAETQRSQREEMVKTCLLFCRGVFLSALCVSAVGSFEAAEDGGDRRLPWKSSFLQRITTAETQRSQREEMVKTCLLFCRGVFLSALCVSAVGSFEAAEDGGDRRLPWKSSFLQRITAAETEGSQREYRWLKLVSFLPGRFSQRSLRLCGG
jgi:hypothetical protein